MDAANAENFVLQDLFAERVQCPLPDHTAESPQAAAAGMWADDGTVALDMANALRDRMEDPRTWQDEQAWLCEVLWLALPCHARAVLRPMLVRLRVRMEPFEWLSSALAEADISTPGALQRELAGRWLGRRPTARLATGAGGKLPWRS